MQSSVCLHLLLSTLPASGNHGSQACPGPVHLFLCVSQRGLLIVVFCVKIDPGGLGP